MAEIKPTRQPAEKKSKKRDREPIPDFVTMKWFRQTFVSTYMAFVGQVENPWEMPTKLALEVMQKIWNATCAFEYQITKETEVYHRVRTNRLGSGTILIYIFQAKQRLADSWRVIIGDTGLSSLKAFFDAREIYNSNEERQRFAKHSLERFRFLYRDSEGEVCSQDDIPCVGGNDMI